MGGHTSNPMAPETVLQLQEHMHCSWRVCRVYTTWRRVGTKVSDRLRELVATGSIDLMTNGCHGRG